jgi:hypothetical protein
LKEVQAFDGVESRSLGGRDASPANVVIPVLERHGLAVEVPEDGA